MRGFALVELLVSMTLMLTVSAVVVVFMRSVQSTFASEPERADMQQRLRVSVQTVSRDLLQAGAGPTHGAHAGPLSRTFAPIVPYRDDPVDGDPAGSFRRGAVTLVYVPPTVAQTTIDSALPARAAWVTLRPDPGCPPFDPACGFAEGMAVVVFDGLGAADRFTVTRVQGAQLQLAHDGADTGREYAPGSAIAEVVARSYFLATDRPSGISRLMRGHANGGADVPVVDHVVGLSFDYLAASPGGLVSLRASELTDGPWLPDTGPNRFDADLLRVRSVGVTIRVQSAIDGLRGPAGSLFNRPGASHDATRWVPDREVYFRVTPRNMSR
jgi:hypothetical protein